ncbi:MAG: hypothetical protein QGH33_12745 [Pirellulaceae bacterium]|nr:hypothetical protein [Pirellulaceae bacterium]
MLKLATILDNPGEPVAETRYRDPQELRRLGFTGLVLFETTALSGVEGPESVATGEVRRWIEQYFDLVRQRIEEARAAELKVYLAYDVLSLPVDLVEADPPAVSCQNGAMMLCPALTGALDRSVGALRALLGQLPEVHGVVLRFGDNDASRLPHLIGNDIYQPHCARCCNLGRADRIIKVVETFYRMVVQNLNKRLIVRAWNVNPNGLHDSVDLCQRVQARLPGSSDDDHLILSFKFTQADFWRYQHWNPASLDMGGRPVIYELECQREFEGKGTIPNWQIPLWRDGPPEMPDNMAGLASVVRRINLVGLWAWVRGGGWGGPFVADEAWIDANVYAVPQLADRPDADPKELARGWIEQRLGVTDGQVIAILQQILEHSPRIVLQAFYIGPFAATRTDPWHPNADWIQDDLVDARAAWRMVQRLPESLVEQAVAEKRTAVEWIASDGVALQRLVSDENRRTLEPLVHSLVYAESLLRSLYHLIAGLVAYRRFQIHQRGSAAQQCRRHLVDAQSHWNQHTQRHSSLPGAATAFREVHFWDLTQEIIAEVG